MEVTRSLQRSEEVDMKDCSHVLAYLVMFSFLSVSLFFVLRANSPRPSSSRMTCFHSRSVGFEETHTRSADCATCVVGDASKGGRAVCQLVCPSATYTGFECARSDWT